MNFDKPQIKAYDRIALRDFNQKFKYMNDKYPVKCINTRLKPIGYLQTFLPTEYIVKAVKSFPNQRRIQG